MQAIVVTRPGGPEVLELQQLPEPVPQAEEVLVNVQAAGLNFADLLSARGNYQGVPPPPFVAGREFSGVVAETGEEVMGYTQWGAFAEKVAARRNLLWPKPAGFNFAEAAAFPVNFFTAYLALWKAGLTASVNNSGQRRRVLIHAIAGGVGTAALQIARALGLETYGTASSDEKLAKAREHGLDHAINYARDDYENAIRDLTRGEGVDAVLEMLGGEHTAKSVRCLRWFGSVISYGSATGKPGEVNAPGLFVRSTSVHGLWLSRVAEREEIMTPAWQQLSRWIDEGKLRPVVGAVLPLERTRDAYQLMQERKHVGKIVLEL
ncbi:MAG: zinc-binding alcohol dehydrogenase family protein [Candidatus Korobacteraceae bacterium]